MARTLRNYLPSSLALSGVVEALILFGSVYFGVMIEAYGLNPTSSLVAGPFWSWALPYTAVMIACIAITGLYYPGLREDLHGILFRLGLAFLLGFTSIMGILTLLPSMSIGKASLAVIFGLSAVGLTLCHAFVFRLGRPAVLKKRVIVLGTGQAAKQIECGLRRKADWRDAQIIGYVEMAGERRAIRDSKVLDKGGSLRELAREHCTQQFIVALDDPRHNFPTEELMKCKISGIEIIDLQAFLEKQVGKVDLDALKPDSVIFSNDFKIAGLEDRVHRFFDLATAAVVLLVGAPIMLATSLAILIESRGRGPILYKQKRVGKNGKIFQIIKFRSMRVGAEESGVAQWAAIDDPRITRVGGFIRKTHIDEFPQVLNVLRGEMSFIGPRPERPEFVEQLDKVIPYYRLRLCVKPGITGWAQIHYAYGASEKDAREKLRYDLYYVKHFGLALNIQILANTAAVAIWGRGAR